MDGQRASQPQAEDRAEADMQAGGCV
jgi:hypothetical protein